MWIERVAEYIDLQAGRNFDFVHAYALSREARQLPDPLKAIKVVRKVFGFAKRRLLRITAAQLEASILYALWGADWTIGEMPPRDREDAARERSSPAIGVVVDAKARKIGLSLDEARSMTASQILEVVARSKIFDKDYDTSYEFNRAMGDYVRARDEVMSRNRRGK